MKADLAAIRTEYRKKSLNKQDVMTHPVDQFELWFNEAINADIIEPTAMSVATVDKSGRPSARIVLLKGIKDKTFLFYTNYKSQKGQELENQPFAALNFFWPELERQVRIEGRVEMLSEKESETYFSTRPKGSKIGAWASPQSEVIESRGMLENNINKLITKYPGNEVPKPPQWGGYRVIPDRMEFWQGRESRLHDRIVYCLTNNRWEIKRLAP